MKLFKMFLLIFFYLGIFFLNSCKNNTIIQPRPIGDPPVYPQIDAYPVWSPDGKWIVYNHYGITRIDVGGSYYTNPDSAGLWLINADGTNPHLILKGNDINADWSPDGKWIVYEKNAQIFKVPVKGDSLGITKVQQLTFDGRNFFPAWSPDGKWIAYNESVCYSSNTCGIWLMQSDGTQHRFLVAYGMYPSWHPSEKKILYKTTAVTSKGEVIGDSLWTFDTGTNTKSFLHFLSGKNRDNRSPKYSPDGSKIVFWSSSNIWIMDSTGGNLRQLTTSGGAQPSWSPDGQEIVYIGFTNNPQDNGTLWIMNADGSNKRQFTYGLKQN